MTLTPKIAELFDKVDAFELVRDQIAAILLVELANQQALATAASKDPALWKLRVFTERSNPWSEFGDPQSGADSTPFDSSPLVNLMWMGASIDMGVGDVVQRQQPPWTYAIDCYGYGISAATQAGHDPGDMRASLEAQRAFRLVRNILMAATYMVLGLKGIVGRRWISNVQPFQPAIDQRPVSHVQGVRATLTVDAVELSPQTSGQTLEAIGLTILRKENTGQVYLTATLPPGV